jgi:GTPase SAR1 family protein
VVMMKSVQLEQPKFEKVVCIGAPRSGATSLCSALVDGFDPKGGSLPEFVVIRTAVEGFGDDALKVCCWDKLRCHLISEQIAYMPRHVRKSKSVLLCLDLSDAEAWRRSDALERLQRDMGEANVHCPDATYFLVGCKSDLVQDKTQACPLVAAFVHKNGIQYLETSSNNHFQSNYNDPGIIELRDAILHSVLVSTAQFRRERIKIACQELTRYWEDNERCIVAGIPIPKDVLIHICSMLGKTEKVNQIEFFWNCID